MDYFELKQLRPVGSRETSVPPLIIQKTLNWKSFPEWELFLEINLTWVAHLFVRRNISYQTSAFILTVLWIVLLFETPGSFPFRWHIYIFTHTHACTHTHIYMYVYIYIYIYIYTHTSLYLSVFNSIMYVGSYTYKVKCEFLLLIYFILTSSGQPKKP